MSGLSRLTAAIGRGLGALASICFRHALLALLLIAGVAATATWSASRLQLDPDITNLLPPTYESVRNVEELRSRFGGVGFVVLMVDGGTPEARRRFADDVAPELSKLERVSFVDEATPVAFFEQRALYFLDLADLEVIRNGLKQRQTYEIQRSYLDLDDEPPPVLDFSAITAKHEARLRTLGGPAIKAPADQSGEPATHYHEDDARTKLAIFVRPTELASDLDFTRSVVADVEGVLEQVRPETYDPGMRVRLTGRYKKRVDLQLMMGADLKLTSSLAMLLVVVYVGLHFRRIFAIVLVLAPLFLGITMSYGVAAALFGKLNILTAFIGAILVGIGIDNGIHILGQYLERIDAKEAPEAAVRTAFGAAGRVSLAAAMTTASAFGALTWTDFAAFREFGTLAACGMILVLAAYVTLLPAMLGMATRFAPRLVRPSAPAALPGVRTATRYAHGLFWIAMVAMALIVMKSPGADFDADFSRLDDADLPSFHLDKEVNQMLGRSQTPMVVLADDAPQARAISEAVRSKMGDLGSEATIGLVACRADFLPDDQAAKGRLIAEISKILSRLRSSKLDASTAQQAERLYAMAQAKPFEAADLPPSLRHVFEPKPGAAPSDFVLLYPTVSMGDADAVRRLAAQLRRIDLPDGVTRAGAGEAMVMADILEAVEADAPRILFLTLTLVLLVLVMTLGNVRLALLALAPALFTVAVTLGLLPFLGLDINYLNMVMVPILLGIGVDDGAHLVARVEEGEPLEGAWRHTGWDVTGAILTDVFGFGVLALASHPGLASLGKLALVGLTVNFLVCVWVLPLALTVFSWVGPRRVASSLAEKVVTMGYAGRSVVAPGTVGALLAIPLALALAGTSIAVRVAVCVAAVVIAVLFSERYVREVASGDNASKDPQNIVIDETVGCLIALLCVPFEPLWVIAAFVGFRAFDILKPGPVRWAERHLRGGLGVVMDDVVAGVLAGALLLGARALISN